jgi:hypothetical protein
MADHRDRAESREPMDPADPTERTERNEPTDPIDRADPTDPMERTDPFDAIDSTEPSDHNDQRELDPPGPEAFSILMCPSWAVRGRCWRSFSIALLQDGFDATQVPFVVNVTRHRAKAGGAEYRSQGVVLLASDLEE